MPSPAVRDVNLMGPNSALPPDIQAQQAQLEIAQQIAQAMIAQGMTGGPATIKTAQGNPFGRDIPNIGGPISQIVNAFMGNQKLGDVASGQLKLAQQTEGIRQQGIDEVMGKIQPHMQEEAGPPTEAGDRSMSVQPGDVLGGVQAGLRNPHPSVQAIAQGLLKNYIDAQEKGIVTPEARGAQLRNVTPNSIASTERAGMFGMPVQTSSSGLQMKPVTGMQPPGDQPIITDPNKGSSAPSGPPLLLAPRVAPPNSPANPSGTQSANVSPTGKVEPINTVESDAAKSAGAVWQKAVDEEHPKVLQQVQTLQKLKDVTELAKRAQFGITAEIRTNALRLAADFGLNTDELGKIPATQTIIARLIPAATAGTKEISSRPALLEFTKNLEATGADKKVDPRHTVDVAGALMGDILNNVEQFNKKLESAKNTPFGKYADNYFVPIKDFSLPKDSPINLQSEGGVWHNEGMLKGRGIEEATTLRDKKPDQVNTIKGKKYYKYGDKWYDAPQ